MVKERSAFACWTIAARSLLVLIAGWLTILGMLNLRSRSDWALGDWLINYAGGFVRRGLLGQGALLFGRVGISPLWAVLVLQWALYAVVLSGVWRLLPRRSWPTWLAALYFSPATLSFVLLDPPFAFRKELLFFALLVMTLLYRCESQDVRTQLWACSALLSAGCAACVLCHEGLIFFMPYLCAALMLRLGSFRRTVPFLLAPAIMSVALFALVSRYPGNAQTAADICASIGGKITNPPSGICGGAIDYLARDKSYAHREVVRIFGRARDGTAMPLLISLSLLPIAVGLWCNYQSQGFGSVVIASAMTVSWLLSTPLFYFGTDWTRWIYVHTFSVLLLMQYLHRLREEDCSEDLKRTFEPTLKRVFATAAVVVYALGWELTIFRQPWPGGGFVHFVRHELPTRNH